MKRKLIRISSIMLLVIVIFSLGTVIAGQIAKANVKQKHPAPGQLVDVGGYKLHLYCLGEGRPTVILAAGLGDFSVTWGAVQPELAKTTRVCTYDRAGYGWSEPSPYDLTINGIADELHKLLVNANVPGPYVLVGHSLSGLMVRVFTHNYPEDVAGMVLVDSTHEEQYVRMVAAVPKFGELLQSGIESGKGQYRFFRFLSSTGVMVLMPQLIPNSGFPEEIFDQYKANWSTTNFFNTILAEAGALEEILADTRNMHITSFGSLPLTVLSAGPSGSDPNYSDAENLKLTQIRQDLQSDLLTLSSDSRQIIAEQSGHYIHHDQPGVVIDAILEMAGALQ